MEIIECEKFFFKEMEIKRNGLRVKQEKMSGSQRTRRHDVQQPL